MMSVSGAIVAATQKQKQKAQRAGE